MLSYSVVICDGNGPDDLAVPVCPAGTFGHVVTMKLPDPQSIYGLPDIPLADMAQIAVAVTSVWAVAWLFKVLEGRL